MEFSAEGKLAALSREQSQLLKLLLEQKARRGRRIRRAERDPRAAVVQLPTSWAQQRLWFIDKLEGRSHAYHINVALRFRGPLNEAALRQALNSLVRRHEALRTVFVDVDGDPKQEIHATATFRLAVIDLSGCEPATRAMEIERHQLEEARTRFDLRQGPLIRGRLLHLDPAEHILLITMHHIISDGWSMGVVMRELTRLYEAYDQGLADPLPPLPIQYADYALWQREWLHGAIRDSQLAYWREQLGGAPAQLELPTDRPRPPVQSFQGESVEVTLDAGLTADLRALAQRHDVTLFMVLYAGWSILLSRLSGTEDVVIGTPVANRQQADLEELIGFFVNTLVLRSRVADELDVQQYLQHVKRMTLEAYQHQDVPFEHVVEALQPERSLGRNPIFQVMFALQSSPRGELRLPGLDVRLETEIYESSMFDLMLSLEERTDRIEGTLNYATDLFSRATVEHWLAGFTVLLREMSQDLRKQIGDLSILTPDGRQRVLGSFNATYAEYPRDRLVHELFEEQVIRTPAATAVEYEGQSLTYAELNAQANQLARHLRGKGLVEGETVAVCLPRSPHMLVGLLGIMKAGCAYIPLDPNYPRERLQQMLEDAAPRLLLTTRPLEQLLPESATERMCLDSDRRHVAASDSTENLPAAQLGLLPANLVYVIFTSGSTGRPKGTCMPHRSMVNLIEWHRRTFPDGTGCRALQFAALSFDVAFQEIYTTLCTGGTLVLLDEWLRRDGRALAQFIHQRSIERLFVPPMMLQSLAECWSSDASRAHVPQDVICAGEQLRITPEISRAFQGSPQCRLHNHYGPTETHVVTALTLDGDPATWPALPTIGRPIANAQIYILDARRRPVPVAVTGEIYIGGAGVAREYLGRPDLSGQRFIADAFSADTNARMYKTGDLGRWLADGTIEYLGRNDDQIKIRGFRVELGEIETRLLDHPQVREAAVVAREHAPGQKRLVAYVSVTQSASAAPTIEQLQAHLKTTLPEHMVPTAVVTLQHLPLTPSGKLNRRALPVPDLDAFVTREYEAPRGALEQTLAGIWQSLLSVERVGRHDNFFELGGHSLLIVQMLEKLRRAGLTAEVRSVYGSRTLAGLAQTLSTEPGQLFDVPPNLIPLNCDAITPEMLPLIELEPEHIARIVAAVPDGIANVQDVYPLAPLQEGMLFHHLLNEGGPDTYIVPTLVSFPSRQALDDFVRALQQVIDRHDMLRTSIMWEQLPRPVQVVQRRAVLPMQEIGLDRDRDAMEHLRELMKPEHQRLDLRRAPLMQLCVAAGGSSHQWHALLQMHHLVCDHESLDLMIMEVISHLQGRAPELPAASPYRKHVAQTLAHARAHDAEVFFRKKLADIDESTAPFGLLDVHGDGSQLNQAHETLDAQLASRVRAQARQLSVSAATLFHAAYALVVSRTTGRENVVFGTVLLGRLQGSAGAQRTLGMFINTLPIRLDLGGSTAKELVERTQRELIELLQHEQASLAMAQRCSGVVRPAPLFTALLNYRHSPVDLDTELATSGVTLHAIQSVTNYPITFSVDDRGEDFVLDVVTDKRIEPQRVMDYVLTTLLSLVEALESATMTPSRALRIIPEAERKELTEQFNDNQVAYPQDKLLSELFQEQTARTPHTTAVSCEGRSFTFDELNRKANQLARHLVNRGVGPDQLVGLCVERSVELVVGMLAILKAGGAYVPLDPDYPPERLRDMLDDAAPQVVLTQQRLLERLPPSASEMVAIDQWDAISAYPATDLDARAAGLRPHHLAYVIFTSGSTGRPKGVMIEQRSVVNLWHTLQRIYEQEPECRRVAVNASFAFDASVKQFIQLLSGRTLLIVPQDLRLDAETLLGFLAQHDVHSIDCTPTQLKSWVSAGLLAQSDSTLQLALIGGEPIDEALWQSLCRCSDKRFYNVYGPTECTVDATLTRLDDEFAAPHIGRPIDNARVHLLDRSGFLVPVGVAGEMHIGGAGVARGYLNRPELTVQRFLADPFSAEPGARLYKTGDLARWRADGTLEYLGRNDDQVKIRGYRVELGEIEAQLVMQPGVSEARVIAPQEGAGDKRLVAYLIPNGSGAAAAGLAAEELRARLKVVLPEHMVPSAFVTVDRWPLTPSGKLDRRALPAPETGAYAMRDYEPPHGEVEELLASIWQELLRVERVGRHDNFFELGGHSLLIVQVMTRLRQVGLSANVRSIYTSPTLSDLARTLTRDKADEFVVPPNLVPPACELITPQMLPLVDLAPVHLERITRAVPGGAANIKDIYPLAPLQEGMLFHHLLSESGGDTYVRPILLALSSRKRLDEFVQALQQVIDRHDILRTAVMWEQLPRPVQIVQRAALLPVEEIALDPQRAPLEQFEERMQPGMPKLDLRRAPMMCMQVAADPRGDQWYALLQLHHLASDHESTDTMLAELMACLDGRASDLPEPVPYRNHVAQALFQARTHDAEAFFRSKLADVDEPTAPFGLLNVHGDGSRLCQAERVVDPQLARRLRAQARRLAVSAATLFHSACALVIAHTSGRDDVVFGSVLLGRLQGSAGGQRTLGMFMNTLPLRLRLTDLTARQLVQQTQKELVQLVNYEQASLAVAQRCSGVPGSAPLFTALLNYRHSTIDMEPKFAKAGVKFLAFRNWTNFPIMLAVDDHGEAFTLTAKVDSSIDPNRTIGYLEAAMQSLVDALERTPQTPAAALSVLPASERREVIELFNQTQLPYPRDKLIHELFEEQARSTPNAEALRWGGEALTYQELDRACNQLAHYLRRQGVKSGDRVGIFMERSMHMVVALLATLKSGGAYVPLDAALPRQRQAYLLEDSAPTVVLTQENLKTSIPPTRAVVICMDAHWAALTGESSDGLERDGLTPEDLAYIMYTSGSTGMPKGVMVRHRNIVNYAVHAARQFDVAAGDGSLLGTSMSFDLCLTGLYPLLICGRAVRLCTEETDLSQGILQGSNYAPVKVTPTHMTLLSLSERRIEGRIRTLVIGGEPLRGGLLEWWRRHSPHTRIFNHYGPTEATVGCIVHEVTGPVAGPVPIGRPIANVQIYILDERRSPVPIGVVGEIYVGGAGVAAGYWGRANLTAERFLPDPFSAAATDRLYKTGDLGRWRADGVIELLGRNDQQVKIRGFRVELAEIEAELLRHPKVRETVVVASEDEASDKRLVAYLTWRHDEDAASVDDLRSHLKAALPDYMIPSAFVIMEQLPVTPNGKLDRRALPAPELGAYRTGEYQPPHGELEEALAEMWQQLLHVQRVGRDDNFFELGGHSLHGVRLIARMAERWRVSLSVVAVFQSPTLREMAQRVDDLRASHGATSDTEEAAFEQGVV